MYCPDTLERINAEAEKSYQEKTNAGDVICDYCNENVATQSVPVYNPADSIRDVTGAYCVVSLCSECDENGLMNENNFMCSDCGEWFIQNHSWDNLTCYVDGEAFCHECGLKHITQLSIADVIAALEDENTKDFVRVNVPSNIEPIWDGEFSSYSDFSGHTSLESVVSDIKQTCEDNGISLDTLVIPAISQTYQFSIVLAIFQYS